MNYWLFQHRGNNRAFPFPSYLLPLFQTELRAKSFLWKWVWFAPKWACRRNSFSYEGFHTKATNAMYYQFLTTNVQRNVWGSVRWFQCKTWDYLRLAQSSSDNKSNGIWSPDEAPTNMIPRYSESLLPALWGIWRCKHIWNVLTKGARSSNFRQFQHWSNSHRINQNIKITAKNYRRTLTKHRKVKKGHGWKNGLHLGKFEKRRPTFFQIYGMSVNTCIKMSFTQLENHSQLCGLPIWRLELIISNFKQNYLK